MDAPKGQSVPGSSLALPDVLQRPLSSIIHPVRETLAGRFPYQSAVYSSNGQTIGLPILNQIPLRVNVVLAGIPAPLTDQAALIRELPQRYTQIDRSRLFITSSSPAYAEYEISYDFLNATDSFLTSYVSFLNTTSVVRPAPSWLKASGVSNVEVTNASRAENQIWSTLPLGLDGFTVVLLNVVRNSRPTFNYYHFYNGSAVDPDFGVNHTPIQSNYMIGYGGAHRMMFTDLSAGPEDYTNIANLNAGTSAPPVIPIWNLTLTTPAGLNLALEEMANSVRYSIEGRFIPSWLYQPSYSPNYELNLTIYSFDPLVRWSTYVIPNIIQSSLAELQFLSGITRVKVTETRAENDPEFYAAFQSARYFVNGIPSYNHTMIEDYITSHLSRYASTSLTFNGEPVQVIPVVALAGADTVDADYSGLALPNSAGDFAAVIEIERHSDLGASGFTYLTIHEVGHSFGLAHPHDLYDSNLGEAFYWVNDFSSTPMSYCCSYDRYDTLAKDNLYQGETSYLLNLTTNFENLAGMTYDSLGFGLVPRGVSVELRLARSSASVAIAAYSARNPNYRNAATNALDAYHHALKAFSTLKESLLSVDYFVTDDKGKPLSNAQVQVTLPNATVLAEITDTQGRFTLAGIPWGNYDYTVIFEGNTVGGTATVENANVMRTISTSVFPLSVPQLVSTENKTMTLPIFLVCPNNTFRVVLPGFAQRQAQNGTWAIAVYYQGVQVYFNRFPLDSPREVDPILAASNLGFRTTDLTGSTLGRVRFTVKAPNGTSFSMVTGPSGFVNLGIVPDGTYEVMTVSWQGVNVSPTQHVSLLLSEATIAIIEARVSDLSIRFSDSLGLSIGGALVTIRHPNGTLISVMTDSNGLATFKNLPIGQFSGTASYLGQSTSFQINSSQLVSSQPVVRMAFSGPSLGILTALPGTMIGLGVFLFKRRNRKRSDQKSSQVQNIAVESRPTAMTKS